MKTQQDSFFSQKNHQLKANQGKRKKRRNEIQKTQKGERHNTNNKKYNELISSRATIDINRRRKKKILHQ